MVNPPPKLPPPTAAYMARRRTHGKLVAATADISDPPSAPAPPVPPAPPPVAVVPAPSEPLDAEDAFAIEQALESVRRESFGCVSPGGKMPTRRDSERLAMLVSELSGDPVEVTPAPPATGRAAPPPLMPERSEKSLAVSAAQQLLDNFAWSKARTTLLPYADSSDVRARCALAECCLQLAEEALGKKDTGTARDLAVEALAHATAAVHHDAKSAAARVWYGQTIQTKAKVLEGGMGQARVCGQMVASWDAAVELAPDEPMAYHLLGSFAFHVSQLPSFAAAAMRQLASGLRKFTTDDSLRYLEQSEARVPSPPPAYSLTNRSMIGRLKLKDGKKAEAKSWLTRAIELEATLGVKLDETARDAADAARKAPKKC